MGLQSSLAGNDVKIFQST